MRSLTICASALVLLTACAKPDHVLKPIAEVPPPDNRLGWVCGAVSNPESVSTCIDDPIWGWRWDDAVNAKRIAEKRAEKARLQQAQVEAEQRQKAEEQRLALLAQRQRADTTAGYKAMSIRDFQLDGRKLAQTHEKVSLRGVYVKQGDIALLVPNIVVLLINNEYGRTPDDMGVVVMDSHATRETRSHLLDCGAQPLGTGCVVTLLGRADICEYTTLVSNSLVPCLDVEGGHD